MYYGLPRYPAANEPMVWIRGLTIKELLHYASR